MRARFALLLPLAGLAACSEDFRHQPDGPVTAAVVTPAETTPAEGAPAVKPVKVVTPKLTAGGGGGLPLARPAAAKAEAYDQTTKEEKAAAVAPVKTGEQKLGSTVASLGNPTEQGFWIKTPLVKTAGKGRLAVPATGKSVNVDLLPLVGGASGGSQVSLAALQMLGVSLTGLPRLDVFKQ